MWRKSGALEEAKEFRKQDASRAICDGELRAKSRLVSGYFSSLGFPPLVFLLTNIKWPTFENVSPFCSQQKLKSPKKHLD